MKNVREINIKRQEMKSTKKAGQKDEDEDVEAKQRPRSKTES